MYTRCYINDKIFKVVIYETNITNVLSDIVMEKNRSTSHIEHNGSYQLRRCRQQIIIPIHIGKYKQNILCDVRVYSYFVVFTMAIGLSSDIHYISQQILS